MNNKEPIIFKIDQDELYDDIIKYNFIEYLGKSRIDNTHMYKLNRQDLIICRVHKIDKIFKRLNKKLVSPLLNESIGGTHEEISDFLDKYRQYITLITIIYHITNYKN